MQRTGLFWRWLRRVQNYELTFCIMYRWLWSVTVKALYPVYTVKLARRAGSMSARRLLDVCLMFASYRLCFMHASYLLNVCSTFARCLLDVWSMFAWWLLDRVNGVLEMQSRGRGFDSRSRRYQVEWLLRSWDGYILR